MTGDARLKWTVLADPQAVAEVACERILARAAEAVRRHGRFRIVLAGGGTPQRTYALLAGRDSEWTAWEVYFGDERCLPPEHPERNSRMAAALLEHVPIPRDQVFEIPAELGPEQAAAFYAGVVMDARPFDLVLLGMGEDGHTASLFPGQIPPGEDPVLAVYQSPKPPPQRVSLSAGVLADSRELLFLIAGASKAGAVSAWRQGKDLPVARIAPRALAEVLIDRAAFEIV
jgi:6-phosphogluconolactonase